MNFTAGVLCVVMSAFPQTGDTDREKPAVSFEEKRLGVLPDDVKFSRYASSKRVYRFSPDGRTIAYAGTKNYKEWVTIGTAKGEEFDGVGSLAFNPDGKTVSYIARRQEKWRLVVGDWKSEEYDLVSDAYFSPDGSKFAYVAQQGQKRFVVAGGKKSQEFDIVSFPVPVWKPDSSGVVFPFYQGGKCRVFADAVEGEGVTAIRDLVFSPDGKILAYVAHDEGKEFVVTGGKKGEVFDRIEALAFAPDGKTVHYNAVQRLQVGAKFLIVLGEQHVGEEYPEASNLTFGPDMKTFGFRVRQETKEFMIVNGKRSIDYAQASSLVFSRDGRNHAYLADVFGNPGGFSRSVVLGSTPGEAFEHIETRTLSFAPDGKSVAYAVYSNSGRKWFVVAGKSRSGLFEGLRDINNMYPMYSICDIRYSLDGRKVAFGGIRGREFWWNVLDVQ